ncbi:MAG: N-acetyltransferase [Acidiferrobacterales bacterium]|nr:N-acetyltransferase [Acidiferrobacterales bacterium]
MYAAELLHKPIVREALASDVDRIYELIEVHMASGVLLPRSRDEIYDNLMKFSVVEVNEVVQGCAALEIFSQSLCEIRSLAVDNASTHRGLGGILVEALIEKARMLGLSRVMALTYVPEFFQSLGFHIVPKSIFPEKVWGVCIKCHKFTDCDEIAMQRNID